MSTNAELWVEAIYRAEHTGLSEEATALTIATPEGVGSYTLGECRTELARALGKIPVVPNPGEPAMYRQIGLSPKLVADAVASVIGYALTRYAVGLDPLAAAAIAKALGSVAAYFVGPGKVAR